MRQDCVDLRNTTPSVPSEQLVYVLQQLQSGGVEAAGAVAVAAGHFRAECN